ncbi:acyltransferase [Rubritalea profundi]|uniref:Acetyltransferase n=1 Tax=Rubritalea profundi TaxID=1658618 RepID=A0A2S7U153_9BACT|nr:DapH/DapD/GlmU-related protein [Rubritalea profundi]PQJ28062.1 hypothetical protein BSZ32_05800 [Rubritalea profundi]
MNKYIYIISEIFLKWLNSQKRQYTKFVVHDRIRVKGEGVEFKGAGFVSDKLGIVLGKNVHIGKNFYFSSDGGMSVGDNSRLSKNLVIYTHNHEFEGKALPYSDDKRYASVNIGKNVWIGMNVSICPGVNIGDGAIVGLGSVVTKDVAENEIVGGSPSSFLRMRDLDHYERVESENRYGGNNGLPLGDDAFLDSVSAKELGENLCYVLSTGRSGSTAIVDSLNLHAGIRAYHEPWKSLVRVSTDFAHGKLTKEEVRSELEFILVKCSSFQSDKKIIISDQKLANLIPFLQDLTPEAKYIWLKREPKACVHSTYAREWYSETPRILKSSTRYWHKYRIQGGLCGNVDADVWHGYSRFEKNCWYYSYWNSLIQKSLEEMKLDKYLSVSLEVIDTQMSEIQAFLGVEGSVQQALKTNKVSNHHKGHYLSKWDEDQVITFNKYFS